ncbi:uncharacterized protein YcnI [Motilibacter peucedani]|uniref:Uncharacterized protein YcnI n=1 Tax=Motilibacter peucedani TaxID=598650 RepID=A0A420XQH5_9ACTN|nr:YcnI family protein [Motilibacter peucedani]RKS75509.1 uncharacterized protein YcnI [Motilibacter peucedani]
MTPTPARSLLRGAGTAGAALLLVVAAAAPASAHVRVTSADASPGGYGVIVFRVPTESDTASTVQLAVTLPADTPFASVAAQPVAGWTVSAPETPLPRPVTAGGFTLTKAVQTVTWKAGTDAGVAPGEFQQFALSVGPFPKGARSIAFPAVQTYSDGTVVHWDQRTTPGAEEPEDPAPVLALLPAATTADDGSTDGTARALAAAGLVVAVLAAGLAGLSLRRRTR